MGKEESLQELFERAVRFSNEGPKPRVKPSNEQLLSFYASYKQYEQGACHGKAPSRLSFVKRAKYDAWKKLGRMSKEDAMKKYIRTLDAVSGKSWRTWTRSKL